MPTFTYLTKFRIDLQKFSSGEELLRSWQAEAQAALQGISDGTFQLWKDAAEPVVYGVITIEADNMAEASWNLLQRRVGPANGGQRRVHPGGGQGRRPLSAVGGYPGERPKLPERHTGLAMRIVGLPKRKRIAGSSSCSAP